MTWVDYAILSFLVTCALTSLVLNFFIRRMRREATVLDAQIRLLHMDTGEEDDE